MEKEIDSEYESGNNGKRWVDVRIILLGPTASGKSELAIQLAEALAVPIISADSRQCYKYLDIGTAKPMQEDLKLVRHYNISILDPDQPDTVQAFTERVHGWEKEISAQHRHVLFVGGSTLHLQSLIRPMDAVPPANAQNIELLNREIDETGLEALYVRLQAADPEYVKQMDGMNRQRIIRALDVWMQTGKPFSSFHGNKEFELPADTLVFGLQYSRETLYERINNRVDAMMEQGLVKEVKALIDAGYSEALRALNAVGYREILEYLDGNLTEDEAVAEIKKNSRRYAKRQLTWFKRWDFIEWLPAESAGIGELKERILSRITEKLKTLPVPGE